MTLYFSNCEPIFAAASRCDYTSRYYKTKGICNKSGTLTSPISKWEGFYDKDASVIVTTGFIVTLEDGQKKALGDSTSDWAMSQGVITLKKGEQVTGVKYDRNGIMNFI